MLLFKKYLRLILFIIVFVIGIRMLQNCVKYGENYMYIFMSGGSMGTSQYLVYLEESIDKYKILGSILSVLGGIGIIIDLFRIDIRKIAE